MDMHNIYRIGIDKISLYNFSVDIKHLKKRIIEDKDNCMKEKAVIEDELFSIVSSYIIYQTSDGISESSYSRITFNPNRILNGNNIKNASVPELLLAIEKLQEILVKKGITVDFSEAKIADIEININMPVAFRDYSEVFLLFIKQFKHSKLISSVVDAEKIENFRREENLFCPISKNLTFKIYDKSIEKNLSYSLTRMEYSLELSTYKYITEKYGLDNYLNTLLSEPRLPAKIFIDRIRKDFVNKFEKYLLKRKDILERQYIAFKKSNEVARKRGRKEERDVYKYLEQFWIFDYHFLIEIISEHDKKHKGREINRIEKKYSKHDNLQKLEKVLEFILPHYTN